MKLKHLQNERQCIVRTYKQDLSDMNVRIANLVREARGEMSLREFSEVLGFSAPYLSDVENLKRSASDKLIEAIIKQRS